MEWQPVSLQDIRTKQVWVSRWVSINEDSIFSIRLKRKCHFTLYLEDFFQLEKKCIEALKRLKARRCEHLPTGLPASSALADSPPAACLNLLPHSSCLINARGATVKSKRSAVTPAAAPAGEAVTQADMSEYARNIQDGESRLEAFQTRVGAAQQSPSLLIFNNNSSVGLN